MSFIQGSLSPCARVLLSLTLFLGTSHAQELPTSRPAAPDNDPRTPMLAAADRALEEGRTDAARDHLLRALWFDPHATEVLERLLAAERADPDRHALWTHVWYAAAADARGNARLGGELSKRIDPKDKRPKSVAVARAQAAAELVKVLKRTRRDERAGAEIVRRFYRALARELLLDAPALLAAHADAVQAVRRDGLPPYRPVLDGLVRAIESGLATDPGGESGEPRDPGLALRAARILQGLASQSRFPALKGERPDDLSSYAQTARQALRQAREILATRARIYSVEELQAMSEQERLAFTRAHLSFDRPAVAETSSGSYRIETNCGHGTLLATAISIEQHHRRLAGWYGRDPFGERQGIVRIVPDSTGLEAEGAGYFWPGGFQSGDVTTIKFTAGTTGSLGQLLTHELTHRFDGAIDPGQPAWLVEGRAVWTETSFAEAADTTFVPNRADSERLDKAWRKEYGTVEELTKLLNGSIEEYRDNYFAGYSLFLYLFTWKEGERRLYGDALDRFVAACRRQRGDAALFASIVCDGQDGRPDHLDAFAKRFQSFLSAFVHPDRSSFIKQYKLDLFTEIGQPVYDAPIWTFARERSEPWFGQGLAARAGELLVEVGDTEAAARALAWAQEVDEWSLPRAALLADLLTRLGQEEAAWTLRNENHERDRRGQPAPGPSPLLKRLPKLVKFLAQLEAGAAEAATRRRPITRAALAADHDRLARQLGLPRIATEIDRSRLPDGPPFDGIPTDLGRYGFVEDELHGFDEHRVEGLWYENGDGAVVVGRSRPRTGTGQFDRAGARQDGYVRSREFLVPGRHRISATVHMETTSVEGAVVLGHVRRDRNIRFTFRGRVGSQGAYDSIECTLHGVREAEAAWAGQTLDLTVRFPAEATSFELEFLIDGGMVVAWVNGQEAGSYHAPDGQAIEGYTGFAVSRGVVRIERPTLVDLRRRLDLGLDEERTRGLSLADEGPTSLGRMIHRPVEGLKTSDQGALLLWVPRPDPEEAAEPGKQAAEIFEVAVALFERMGDHALAAPLVLILPAPFDAATGEELRGQISRKLGQDVTLAFHDKREPLVKLEDAYPVPLTMAIYIDPQGVLRTMTPVSDEMAILPHELRHWISVYRGALGGD